MNKRLSESTILKLIVLLPIVATILTSIILTNIFIRKDQQSFQTEIQTIEKEHIANIKNIIKDRINRIIDLLRIKNNMHIQNSKKELQNLVNMGYKIIEATHEEYKNEKREVILKELHHILSKVRFYENQSGYFFITGLDGSNILHPILDKNENKSLLDVQDFNGKYIIRSILNNLKQKDESFDTWYWSKDGGKTYIEKLGFYKKYAPLDLYIGTGKYFDDIHMENLENTYAMLTSIKYNDNNYIFAINDQGVPVVHPNKKIHNKAFKNLSLIEQEIVQNILDQREFTEGAFIEYKPTTQKNEKNPSYKISFVKYVPELKLIIGTGLYTNELNEIVQYKTLLLKNKLKETIQTTTVISVIVTSILIFIMILISNALKGILNNYAKELANKNKDLEELNNDLEQKVIEEVEKNRKQDDILNQQSKMAAMGEMLGNISHQWRQPLSAISTTASGIKFQDEMNILKKEEMHNSLDSIVKNTQMLSQTIDDFRNFFNPKKELSIFNIKECFDKLFVLVWANLKNKDIEVIQSIQSVELFSHQNELIQALLNIVNNAKDALDTQDIEQKYIFIDVTQNEEDMQITIKDNANGIPKKLMSRIFEPYFTTKHQSHGTGIGLFMTKKIIESNLEGTIRINNETFAYEGKEYQGASCIIRLPKNLNV